MAQAKDPLNMPMPDSRDPEAPRFLNGAAQGGSPAPDTDAARATRPRVADYAKASPEEIAADIERTRAHMDETLHLLSRRLKPRLPGRALLAASGIAALAVLAWLGWSGYLGFRRRHSLVGRLAASSRKGKRWFGSIRRSQLSWRGAGIGEQGLLAAKLAMAARKGKPAVIVVEPRHI